MSDTPRVESLRLCLSEMELENAALRERIRELRDGLETAQKLQEAALPFVKIVCESSGRIPTELLSLANWHELVKAHTAAIPKYGLLAKEYK